MNPKISAFIRAYRLWKLRWITEEPNAEEFGLSKSIAETIALIVHQDFEQAVLAKTTQPREK